MGKETCEQISITGVPTARAFLSHVTISDKNIGAHVFALFVSSKSVGPDAHLRPQWRSDVHVLLRNFLFTKQYTVRTRVVKSRLLAAFEDDNENAMWREWEEGGGEANTRVARWRERWRSSYASRQTREIVCAGCGSRGGPSHWVEGGPHYCRDIVVLVVW